MSSGADNAVKGACRSFFCTLLKWPLGNVGSHERADGYRIRKVLVLRHDTVRHMVASFPSFRLIKRLAPQASLDVLASKANREVAQACPEVDSTIEFPDDWFGRIRVISALRERHYDLILNLMFDRASGNGVLANLIGGRRAIKVAHYPKIEHSVFANIQALTANRGISIWEKLPMLVAEAFRGYVDLSGLESGLGIDPQSEATATKKLQGLGLDSDSFLAICCSAKESAFCWTEGAFTDLVGRTLRHLGLKVLLVCEPADQAMVVRLRSAFTGVEIYPMGAPIMEQAAVLARARVVVTLGLTLPQICYAVKAPVVSLCPWLGDAQELWRPDEELRWRQIVAPPGCGAQVIQIDRVWEAVRELAVR